MQHTMISVICPTSSSRRPFHEMLYRCFALQTYEPRELVVVETCECGPSAFWQEKAESDPRVVYRHFAASETAWSIGLKRNVACYLSIGQVIAHFDDDDAYSPCYLERMVLALAVGGERPLVWSQVKDLWGDWEQAQAFFQEHGETALGEVAAEASQPFRSGCASLSKWFCFDVRKFAFGAVTPENDRDLYGWGFSFIYTRRAWKLRPFPHKGLGEDYDFVQGLRALGVRVTLFQDEEVICAHTEHADNTSGGHIGFQRVPASYMPMSCMAPILMAHEEAMKRVKKVQGKPKPS